ncbi:MAG: hypothetical protein NVS3B16_20900 [Vulcanimicrobiaceae bacterium]
MFCQIVRYVACARPLASVCALAVALVVFLSGPARAGTGSAYLSGTVIAAGMPAPGIAVTAAGNNFTSTATTDAAGRFTFPALPIGPYTVSASSPAGSASTRVDLSGNGATVDLDVSLKEIGATRVVRSASVRGSGTDVTLTSPMLQRSPESGNFSEFLTQLPGAARGANGVVHLNGDHGVVNYVVDGVPIPQALNRQLGSEIDPSDISYVDVVEGAFPAQYGLRFGSTLNIATRAGTGPAGFNGELRGGSYAGVDQSIGYHAPLANGGGLSVALRDQRSMRGLDPPNFDSPHNDYSNTNQFLRLVAPRGGNNFTDLTVVHSYRSYQIPNDVAGGQPAAADLNEKQDDTFVNLQFRQSLGDTGSLSFGPALKISRIRDFGDEPNDFTYGQALYAANGGAPDDCATALTSLAYGNGTCAYSLRDDKTSTDYRFQTDYVQRFGRHEIRAGGAYQYTDVGKRYAVTLQPNNFLAPLVTPSSPDGSATVVDNDSNAATTYESFVQDSWKIGSHYQLDYGLRYDFFAIASTDFAQGFGAFSPRVKLTRFFGPRASVYAYFGRLFEPFSFENVAPRAAQLLNLPNQPTLAQFDLKPERDSFLEAGAHIPVGSGSLGLRAWQKNAADLIDDTQVGVTLLHQDINYAVGRLSQQAAYYERPLARNGRAYVSVAHTVSLNKGCETQLLAPCFGSPTDFTSADHDQRYSVTGGALLNDRHNGWFAFDGEYGSGLSSASCPASTPNCKRTPHTIFAFEKGFGIGPDMALTVRVQNLFNDRYFVTLLNAQGNHYATPRTIDIGFRFGR